jgi:hypothetical protein
MVEAPRNPGIRTCSAMTMKVRGSRLKGVVFNLLEQAVSEEAGAAARKRPIAENGEKPR